MAEAESFSGRYKAHPPAEVTLENMVFEVMAGKMFSDEAQFD